MDKQHILAEIKRTADANAGIPLGRTKFYQNTGIKESDWAGIHWARWGDVIKEAGYKPNKLQEAHPEDYLLEQYVGLIHELERIPVAYELRLKKRHDPLFPSHNTFGRFGSKQELLQKTIEFCQARENLDDIVKICEIAIKPTSLNDEIESKSILEEFGFVYLIQSGRFYKIGKTNSVGRRERELSIQLPEKTKTVHSIRTDDPEGIERYWHLRFKAKRKNGEWFELSHEDIMAFKRRKFM